MTGKLGVPSSHPIQNVELGLCQLLTLPQSVNQIPVVLGVKLSSGLDEQSFLFS